MNDLYLIVRIDGRAVALPATQVGSVVEVDEIAPVPRVPAHVAGLFALRSRVLTVIDTRAALRLAPADRAGNMHAVIVAVDGHSYALLVDEVDDVIQAAPPEPSAAVLTAAWECAALGTIRSGDQAILVLDPAVLIGGCLPLAA